MTYTYAELEAKRLELANHTSMAYSALRAWMEKSVKETDPINSDAAMELVYDWAARLTSCREEELEFLNNPVEYMCKD